MDTAPLQWSSLTALDWAMIALVSTSTLLALRNGLIKTVFSTLGLVAGGLAAAWYYSRLAAWLHPWIAERLLAQVCAFASIWMATSLCIGIFGAFLSKSLSAVGLGVFDRILGAAFGLFRGILLGSVVMALLVEYVPNSNWLQRSRTFPCFRVGLHALSFVVPTHLKEQLAASTIHLLKHSPEPLAFPNGQEPVEPEE